MKIAVIGLGNWGTALANHLTHKGFDTLVWGNDSKVTEEVNTNHKNPLCLSHVTLHSSLKATTSLKEAIKRDIIVLALPSSALSDIVPKLEVNNEAVIISAIKGLEGESLLTPLQYISRYGTPCKGLAVLSGPSFAKDIVMQRPSGVVAASKDEAIARTVADIFGSEWMRIYISTDPLGVELGGIVKNVIALAAGFCDGFELGDSARAGLITRGLAEMMRLAEAMGAEGKTLFGLSGLGDLVMTSTCDASRNRTVGIRLGRGEKLEDIIKSIGSVAEGVTTTSHVLELSQKYGVEMPITTQVSRFLSGKVSPKEAVRELIGRPLKREF